MDHLEEILKFTLFQETHLNLLNRTNMFYESVENSSFQIMRINWKNVNKVKILISAKD